MRNVLVFEDDSSSQELLKQALAHAGLTEVMVVSDGAEGLKELESMSPEPDLIVCDIFMPETDGIEVIDNLVQRNYPGALILVTGGDPSMLIVAETIAHNKGLRLLGVLKKPVFPHQLSELIRES